jgi:hypothetical protein
MGWFRRLLPWYEHKQIRAERAETERRAAEVHHRIVEPLRAMRTYDIVTQAIVDEVRRQARGEGEA